MGDGKATLYDVNSGNIIKSIVGESGERLGHSVVVSGDGIVFAVGSYGYPCETPNSNCGRVQVFNTTSHEKIGSDIMGTSKVDMCGTHLDSSNFSNHDGTIVIGCLNRVISASYDEQTRDFSIRTITSTKTSNVEGTFGMSVAISPDNQMIAVGEPGRKHVLHIEVKGLVKVFGEPIVSPPTLKPSEKPSVAPSTYECLESKGKGKGNSKGKGAKLSKGKGNSKGKGTGKGAKMASPSPRPSLVPSYRPSLTPSYEPSVSTHPTICKKKGKGKGKGKATQPPTEPPVINPACKNVANQTIVIPENSTEIMLYFGVEVFTSIELTPEIGDNILIDSNNFFKGGLLGCNVTLQETMNDANIVSLESQSLEFADENTIIDGLECK